MNVRGIGLPILQKSIEMIKWNSSFARNMPISQTEKRETPLTLRQQVALVRCLIWRLINIQSASCWLGWPLIKLP